MNARTEAQAERLHCPMQFGKDCGGACLSSRCMAWRWTEVLVDGPDSYKSEPGPTGYCGLAGKP